MSHNKFQSSVMKALKDAFPYFSQDDGRVGTFCGALVGTTDIYNVLIRTNFEHKNGRHSVTFGVVDDDKNQFLYNDIEKLKEKVSQILKERIDKETKAKKDSLKVDFVAMKLCGFLTQNGLTFSTQSSVDDVVVNIFGTAFDKLSIFIYKSNPDVYEIRMPRASFNKEQVEKFILTCKSLKE